MQTMLFFLGRTCRRLARLVQFLVGVQDGDRLWDADTAYRLICISSTAEARISAIELCILRGVPLEYCLTLGRIVPRLEDECERAEFAAWLGIVSREAAKTRSR